MADSCSRIRPRPQLSHAGKGNNPHKEEPKIIGIAVPSASTSKKSDVLPGKSVCEMDEKKKAESPKPDMTKRQWSGKFLAVVFKALIMPACPPTPLEKLQRTRIIKRSMPRIHNNQIGGG
ncbi:hypothetical protein BGY98DRAFT_947311 [Russula aff. rugulosa BPL654]|nr:hypothetical protein BGY98DRAFT_947311 [Russula aff. rugulosa BPL654]